MEAATVAWHHMGWQPVGFAEIEPFPSAILKHHYPHIPNYGNLTEYKQWPIERGSIDLLVSGTPCQAFSIAGLRQGLADPRGNLALVFLGLVDRLRPKYILWENVQGVLSSNKGEDFAAFIGALAELRYGFAWRVCDAQFFGVPQRRKRVFLLAVEGVGNWRTAAEILFEPEGLCGNFEESRKKRKSPAADAGSGVEAGCEDITLFENRPSDSRITGPHNISPTMTSRFGTGGGNIPLIQHTMPGTVAPTIGASGPPYSRTGNERVEAEALAITFQPGNLRRNAGADPSTTTTTTLKASAGDQTPHVCHPVVPLDGMNLLSRLGECGEEHSMQNFTPGDPSFTLKVVSPIQDGREMDKKQNGLGVGQPGDPAYTLDTTGAQAIAIQGTIIGRGENAGPQGTGATEGGPMFTLTKTDIHGIATPMAVRRLTPVECERLQGFPDNYSQIPWKNKSANECPDGPRYKACGNSMAVPVMRWIGERINNYENTCRGTRI